MDFQITDYVIDPSFLLAGMRDTGAGACVTFEGRVRNLSGGRSVEALEYQAYVPLAEKEGGRIIGEAREKFQLLGALCVHRTGRLALGDIAVWVAVIAPHRAEAFEACRYIIDETKERVPIWKKEHYCEGAAEWVNCATRGAAEGGTRPA
jgi:molybdopterin synthase catalytic subunit